MCKNFMQRVLLYRRKKRQFLFMEKQGIFQYETYFFAGTESLFFVGMSAAVVLFFAFFFYRSMWAIILLWPLGVWLYFKMQKEKGEKRRAGLEAEFQDCMYALSASLRAGCSVEHAFEEVLPDIESLYGHESLMAHELRQIKKGLTNNISLERLLIELGERSGTESIREFGEVFAISRLSGGDLPGVLTSTAELIGEKIALKKQLQVIISGRKLEQNVMSAIPFFLVCYVEATNKGFFDVLYREWFGRFIMTGCLLIYLIAFVWAQKICSVGG